MMDAQVEAALRAWYKIKPNQTTCAWLSETGREKAFADMRAALAAAQAGAPQIDLLEFGRRMYDAAYAAALESIAEGIWAPGTDPAIIISEMRALARNALAAPTSIICHHCGKPFKSASVLNEHMDDLLGRDSAAVRPPAPAEGESSMNPLLEGDGYHKCKMPLGKSDDPPLSASEPAGAPSEEREYDPSMNPIDDAEFGMKP
jgi:hypothetical protein